MRELMVRYQNRGHMTMMADPDIIEELGADAIQRLTRQGNTNFSVVAIEDEDRLQRAYGSLLTLTTLPFCRFFV